MKEFMISAEAFCDMDPAYMQENHVNLMGAVYALSDDEYQENTPNSLDPKTFYDRLRKGEMPRTSQVSVEQSRAAFEEIVRSGRTAHCLFLCPQRHLSVLFDCSQ